MRGLLKLFALIFGVLTVAAFGHDLWRALTTENGFTFSQIGGLFQAYARDEHDALRQAVVDTAGAEGFNTLLVPILRMYTVALTGGLMLLCLGLLGLQAYLNRDRTYKFKSGRS